MKDVSIQEGSSTANGDTLGQPGPWVFQPLTHYYQDPQNLEGLELGQLATPGPSAVMPAQAAPASVSWRDNGCPRIMRVLAKEKEAKLEGSKNCDAYRDVVQVENLLSSGQDACRYKRIVLVIGRTVNGKSTLCRLLRGKEMTIKEELNTMVLRGKRIGEDGLSCTSDPLFFKCESRNKETVVLCDCPGTDDTRGALVDMKQKHKVRLATSGAGIKALMVVQYSAFLPDECASTFMSVVQYTVALLAGLDTFHAAVFLVVTKVPSDEYREVNGKPELVTDDEYKKAIRGFLVKVVGGALQPVTGDPQSRALECGIEDAQQLEQCKRLVDALLDEKLDRLELVHRPARRDVGKKSTDCDYLKGDRKRVLRMLRRDDDSWIMPSAGQNGGPGLGIALAEPNRLKLQCQAAELTESVRKILSSLESTLKDSFRSELHFGSPADTLQRVEEWMDIAMEPNVLQSWLDVRGHFEYLRELQDIACKDIMSPVEALVNQHKKNVADFVKLFREICHLLLELSRWLWSYKAQARPTVPNYDASRSEHSMLWQGLLENELKEARLLDKYRHLFTQIPHEPFALNTITDLLYAGLNRNYKLTEEGEAAVTVKGTCLVLSIVLQRLQGLRQQPNKVVLLALDTVFLDCDVDMVGRRLKLAVVAPHWEVVKPATNSPHVIDLSGEPGAPFERAARAGESAEQEVAAEGAWLPADAERGELAAGRAGRRGHDGEPGRPGGPGGAFLGLGSRINNGCSLTISARGGRGSDGQRGGDGGHGEKGCDVEVAEEPKPDAKPSAKSQKLSKTAKRVYATGKAQVLKNFWVFKKTVQRFHGSPAGAGGPGGHGGCGGPGGRAGTVALLLEPGGARSAHSVVVQVSDGANGDPGDGGAAGSLGDPGAGYEATYETWFGYWNTAQVFSDNLTTDDAALPANGVPGKAGAVQHPSGRDVREPAITFSDAEIISVVDKYLLYYRCTEAKCWSLLHPERLQEALKFAKGLQERGWRKLSRLPEPQRPSQRPRAESEPRILQSLAACVGLSDDKIADGMQVVDPDDDASSVSESKCTEAAPGWAEGDDDDVRSGRQAPTAGGFFYRFIFRFLVDLFRGAPAENVELD